uniref:Translocon-associated protein subunit delta n=1 Tax=Parascaris univalens TaxID=6257 RepID=A0A915CJ75_PARUN
MMSLGLRLAAHLIRFEYGVVKPACSLTHDANFSRTCIRWSCRSLCCHNNQSTSSLSCSRFPPLIPMAVQNQQVSQLCFSSHSRRMWRITMDDEEKKRKRAEIDKLKKEERPVGLFAKVKYYVKRYWYIAIPVHFVGSLMWFGGLYAAVRSGIDIISLLEHLHLPESLIDRVKNTPPSAGV